MLARNGPPSSDSCSALASSWAMCTGRAARGLLKAMQPNPTICLPACVLVVETRRRDIRRAFLSTLFRVARFRSGRAVQCSARATGRGRVHCHCSVLLHLQLCMAAEEQHPAVMHHMGPSVTPSPRRNPFVRLAPRLRPSVYGIVYAWVVLCQSALLCLSRTPRRVNDRMHHIPSTSSPDPSLSSPLLYPSTSTPT